MSCRQAAVELRYHNAKQSAPLTWEAVLKALMDWIFVTPPPKFMGWNTYPIVTALGGGAFRRLRAGGQSSPERIKALIRRDRWACCSSLLSAKWGHKKNAATHSLRNRISPEISPLRTLTLDFSASKMVRNKCLWFCCCCCYISLSWQRPTRIFSPKDETKPAGIIKFTIWEILIFEPYNLYVHSPN